MARQSISDFSLANAIYKGATVTFYTVLAGVKTSTKATLYAAETGTTTLLNPQKLGADGKFIQPVYIEEPVIGAVSGLTIPDHDTGVVYPSDAASAAASAAAAALSEAATAADVVLTHADVVLTHADVVLTNADVISTAADVVLTAADAVATAADRVQTGLDAVATAADRVQTGLDAAEATAIVAKATSIVIAVSDETSSLTTGTAKVTFRMPYAFTLSEVRASLTTTSSSGNPTFDINEGGTSILSTKLTVDAGELTSTTAATPAVISDANLADDAEITVDIDAAGTGAVGAKIYLLGVPA